MKIAGFTRGAGLLLPALLVGACGPDAKPVGGAPDAGAGGAGGSVAPARPDGGGGTAGSGGAGGSGGTGGAGPVTGTPGAFVERPCTGFRPAPTRPVKCGVVIVPEARPAGTRMVEISVVVIKATGPTPAPDPLLFLQGGPGGGGVDFIVQVAGGASGPLDAVLAKRDVISIDQRGTGRSLPSLACPEVNQAAMMPMMPPMMMMSPAVEALGRCRTRLTGMGIDLSQYHTNAAADDVEDVRKALGYQQWNVLGGSYGTRLALEVVRRHPAGVRTLLLDSVSPPDVDLIGESGQNSVRVLESAWAICAAQPACARAYPNLGPVFNQSVAKLNAMPARLLGGLFPLDGDTYLQLVLFMLRSPAMTPDLPEIVYQTSENNYTLLQQKLLALVQATMGGGAAGAISMGLHLSVMCADYLPFTTKAMIEAKAMAIAPELRSAMLRTGLGYIDNCRAWNVTPSPASVFQAVTSPVPTLVLAGSMDPATPPRWGEQAAKTLSASHFFELRGVSHGVFPTMCGSAILPPFLDAPTQKPAPACLSTLADVQFKVQR